MEPYCGSSIDDTALGPVDHKSNGMELGAPEPNMPLGGPVPTVQGKKAPRPWYVRTHLKAGADPGTTV